MTRLLFLTIDALFLCMIDALFFKHDWCIIF